MFLGICSDILDDAELTKSLKTGDYSLILKNEKIFDKIQKYIKEFFWIKTTFYSSKKITPVVLLEEVGKEKLSKGEILKEIKNIEKSFLDIVNEKQKLLKTMELTKEDKRDIEFARLTIYWIDQRKVGTMKHFYYFSQLFMDIAKRFKMDYHELAVSRVEEVEKLLKTGDRLDRKVIERRNNSIFSIYEKDNKRTDYYGDDAEDLLILAKKSEDKEVKGIVASKTEIDKITGVVKIIKNPEKEEISKGEILVTSMTRVEFVPMMRKAKAIVTDEGGVLKNGDIVEIDMDEGVVRKLR